MENFRKRLKELRLQKGYTQQELGDLIKVSKPSISGYESGKRTPTIHNIYQLAKVLGVSVDYLVGQDVKGVDTNNESNVVHISGDDLDIIKEMHKYPSLYEKLLDSPEKTIKLLSKSLNKSY